ncbi:MAG: DUF4388 domain-containing protein [Actinomycetota bacterium]
MALQGTLSDFGVDEVLRMLDLGKKQGRLRVTGGPGDTTGNLWVENGRVLGSALGADAAGDDHTEVVFQLMRLDMGEFHFHGEESVDTATVAEEIGEVIEAATARLAEWKQLSTVLPSLDQWLVLSPAIATAVTVEPAQWAVLSQVGSGMQIQACVDALGMGLVPGCRLIAELVDRSLLSVTSDMPARVVEVVGKVDPQLPSVGAPDTAEAKQAPAEPAKPAAKPTDQPAEKPAEPKEPVADAPSEKTDQPADEAALAERAASDEQPAEGEDDDDVNPRALLRLLNSVK